MGVNQIFSRYWSRIDVSGEIQPNKRMKFTILSLWIALFGLFNYNGLSAQINLDSQEDSLSFFTDQLDTIKSLYAINVEASDSILDKLESSIDSTNYPGIYWKIQLLRAERIKLNNYDKLARFRDLDSIRLSTNIFDSLEILSILRTKARS